MLEKKELRKKMKEIRAALDEKTREEKSEKIFENLKKFELFMKAENVMSFMSFNTEVNTLKINDFIFSKDKTLLLPRVVDKTTIIPIINKGEFTESNLGILEPVGEKFEGSIDFIITPGLAFDLEGNRLGYGRGYYDRFLDENYSAIRCAICFEEQIVDKVPTENFDTKLDFLITDKNIYKFKMRG